MKDLDCIVILKKLRKVESLLPLLLNRSQKHLLNFSHSGLIQERSSSTSSDNKSDNIVGK